MGEECRLCGATVHVPDAAHVMLNAPERGVDDCYVCPGCFEASVAPLFAGETGSTEGREDGSERAPDAVPPE